MPVQTLDVFANLVVKLVAQRVLLVADIAHVEAAVVAARKEGLLVCSVPAHSLHFVAVEISVSGFASQFIEIPHAHCGISTTREQVLPLEGVKTDRHHSVGMCSLRYFAGRSIFGTKLFYELFLLFTVVYAAQHSHWITIFTVQVPNLNFRLKGSYNHKI